MSKIGNLRSGSYGGGNSHTYDGKVKPKKTLADVRKARELAQKKARKTTISPKVAEAASDDIRKNLNERITSRMGNTSYYGGKTVKSGGQFISITPEQVGAQAKRVPQSPKALGTGNVTVFDASKGLHVSATPEQARLIEAANRNLATPNLPAVVQKPQYNIGEILNGGNKFNLNNPFASSSSNTLAVLGNGTNAVAAGAGAGAGGIGSGARAGAGAVTGTPNLPAVIQKRPTELSVVSQTVTEETKKPGLWSKLKGGISGLFGKAKNALKTGWGKFKAFAKTPKGKWGLVIAAVALIGTVLGASVVNRFSSKNNPTPTNGPDKINMPVADVPNKVEDEDTDDVDDVEETEKTTKNEEDDEVDDEDVDADKKTDKTDTTESTKVVPVPVDTDDDEDVDEVDETDKTKKADESDKTDKSDKTEKAEETDKTDKTDKTDETKVPATEAEKKEADKVADANKDKREPDKVSGNEYEVVEGDCVWNIAKAHLKELNKDKADYTPSNVEILRHTKELMKINYLHYEADNYVVIIQPGQKIKLK